MTIEERAARAKLMKKAMALGRPYRASLAFLLVFTVVSSALGLINPLIYRHLINAGILKGNTLLILELAILAGMIAIAEALFAFTQRRLANILALRIYVDLGSRLFGQLQKMPIAFFSRTKTGSTVSRLDDEINGVSDAFTDLVTGAVSSCVIIILVLAAMFTLSWKITVGSLILLPVFVLPARSLGQRVRLLLRDRYARTAEKKQFAIEHFNVGGALVGKIFGRPSDDLAAFDRLATRVRDVRLTANFYASALAAGLGLVASLAVAALYGWGGALAARGQLDLGALVALTSYLLRLAGPLAALGNLQVSALSALVSFERIFELLELEPLVQERLGARPIPPGPASIAFEGVSFGYPSAAKVSRASFESVAELSALSETPVLHQIDFVVEANQLVALVGRSGAGKTTIAQLTARLYDPTLGAVKINGVDLREATLDSVRSAVGMVTQESYFFHDTVRANLLYAKHDASAEELIDALQKAQILPVVEALPQGMDTVIGERGHRLSGGEKQRLAIARVLLKSPRIVILDEATAHLDSASEQAVQIAFRAALAGRTSLVIAHRLSTVRNADCILVVDEGRILERGRHQDLIALKGLYHRLYQTQFRDD